MSALQLRIIKRAIKSRLSGGEEFDDIVKDYPKVTAEEIEQIKNEIE